MTRSQSRKIAAEFSRRVRAAAGMAGSPWPILVVPGKAAPHLCGRSYYWTTPSGLTEVRHPSAYKWPTLYHEGTEGSDPSVPSLRPVGSLCLT